jgi:hypothetical protein
MKELDVVREKLLCGEQMGDFSQFTKTFHKGMFLQFFQQQSKAISLALFWASRAILARSGKA